MHKMSRDSGHRGHHMNELAPAMIVADETAPEMVVAGGTGIAIVALARSWNNDDSENQPSRHSRGRHLDLKPTFASGSSFE